MTIYYLLIDIKYSDELFYVITTNEWK